MKSLIPQLDVYKRQDIFIGSEFVYEKMLEAGKSVKENCEYLYNKGPEIVIFTFGEKGCAGISKEGFFEIPAFDVDVKDTVGAGDVFHGAFLAAIVKGLSPKDAARFASGVAAIKCTRIGAVSYTHLSQKLFPCEDNRGSRRIV